MTKRLLLAVALLLALAVPAAAQSDLEIQRFNTPTTQTSGFRVHGNTTSVSVTVTGDVRAAGGYKSTLVFAHDNYAHTTAYSNAATPIAGTTNRTSGSGNPYAPIPTSGSIIGVSIAASTALTNVASAHAEATIYNGTTKIRTGLTAVIGATLAQTQFNTATQARGVDPVTAGRGVGCDTSTASFGQTNVQLTCIVIFEH